MLHFDSHPDLQVMALGVRRATCDVGHAPPPRVGRAASSLDGGQFGASSAPKGCVQQTAAVHWHFPCCLTCCVACISSGEPGSEGFCSSVIVTGSGLSAALGCFEILIDLVQREGVGSRCQVGERAVRLFRRLKPIGFSVGAGSIHPVSTFLLSGGSALHAQIAANQYSPGFAEGVGELDGGGRPSRPPCTGVAVRS